MSGSNGFCWFYVQQNVVIEANSLRFDNISKYADHRAGTILLLTVSLVWAALSFSPLPGKFNNHRLLR